MLKRLSLLGLKAHEDEVVFHFSGVDMLVGANSTGKSTIIQSLLLLKQSVDRSIKFAGVKTRGKYVDLGSAGNLVNRKRVKSGASTIEIGISYGEIGSDVQSEIKLILIASQNGLALQSLVFDGLKFEAEIIDGTYLSSSDSKIRLELNGLFAVREQHQALGKLSAARQFEIGRVFEKRISNVLFDYLEQIPKKSNEERLAKTSALDDISRADWVKLLDNVLFSTDVRGKNEPPPDLIFSLNEIARVEALAPSLIGCISVAGRLDDIAADCLTILEEIILFSASDAGELYVDEDRGIARKFNEIFFNIAQEIRHVGPIRPKPLAVYPYAHCARSDELRGGSSGFVGFIHENSEAPSALILPDGTFSTTKAAIDAWMSHLGIASSIFTEEIIDAGYLLKISTAMQPHYGEVKGDSPVNVGMGVTQFLPVIASLALAPAGSIILIEQPELHLHPSVSVKVGELLSAAAKSNLRLIVESHSDHIVNGVRISISKKLIDPGLVCIHFFEQAGLDEGGHVVCQTLVMNDLGFLDYWPKGFFDENEQITKTLLMARRNALGSTARNQLSS
jgi:predicted ATPase